jgi:hypothetical protein
VFQEPVPRISSSSSWVAFLGVVDSSTLVGGSLSDTIIVSYAGYPTRKTFTLLAVKVTLDTVRAWKIT